MSSIPILIISICLLLLFLKLNIKNSCKINIVSSATFGVYLIHDHNLVRINLWGKIFKNAKYSYSSYLIVYSIAVVLLVFVICTAIELVRKYLIENRYMNMIDSFITRISKKIDA